MDNKTKKTTVYFDGSCPMCTAFVGAINSTEKGSTFSMQDITKDSIPTNLSKDKIEKEIHIVKNGAVYKNAEAILGILSEYPAWKGVVWFGSLPLIKQILPIGYNFIANNRHFLFGSASRLYWIKIIVSLGLITSLLLSLKLWIGDRFFPTTPIFSVLPSNIYPFDFVIIFLLLGSLIATILSSRPRVPIFFSIFLIGIMVILDQQRIQPWIFQYTFMLLTLGLFSWDWKDKDSTNKILNTCRLLVACIYFWSGVQKVNIYFLAEIFPWMISPIVDVLPSKAEPMLYTLGIFVPFIEIGIGVGLLTRKFRNLALIGATTMCFFVLATLGPLGHNWNSVVWPWNIALLTMAIILFYKTNAVSLANILWVKNDFVHKIIILIFGLLPSLYFINFTDSYISWSLYSGTIARAEIYVSENALNTLPEYLQSISTTKDRGTYISPTIWSFDELNVPPYPEKRIFMNTFKTICDYTNEYSSEVDLVLYERKTFFTDNNPLVYKCN